MSPNLYALFYSSRVGTYGFIVLEGKVRPSFSINYEDKLHSRLHRRKRVMPHKNPV